MIARRPGCLKTMSQDSAERELERFKASVRSKVEHVFKRVKLDMGYSKTRYRGIKKNARRISTLLAAAGRCWPLLIFSASTAGAEGVWHKRAHRARKSPDSRLSALNMKRISGLFAAKTAFL